MCRDSTAILFALFFRGGYNTILAISCFVLVDADSTMLAGVKAAAKGAKIVGKVAQAAGQHAGVAPSPEWTTRMTQHDGAVNTNDWLYSCFCTPCAAAQAKGNVDRTHPCYNFLCWTPIAGYSYVRLAYGINGTCGDDMMWGIFCPCCITRQMYTESNIRGGLNGSYGANQGSWNHSLFDCTPCELCEATFCVPCVTHSVRTNLPNQDLAERSCCFDALCVMPTSLYGQVRNDYGILSDLGPVEDIFLPIICFPCALNRARKEASLQKSKAGGGGLGSGLLSKASGKVGNYGARM